MNEQFMMLLSADKNQAMSTEQRTFVEVHTQIITCGKLAGTYAIEMARKLKEMRDGKLYRVAGFEDFKDYTKEACGIEERQAYNYITVAEKYTEKYLAENADLGITKLLALSKLSEEEREEIIETVDVRESSTKELKEAIERLTAERDNAQSQLSILQEEAKEKDESIKSLTDAYNNNKTAIMDKNRKIRELELEKKKLEDQKASEAKAEKNIKENALPIEVYNKIAEQETDLAEANKKIEELESKSAKAVEEAIKAKDAEIEKIKAEKKVIASSWLLRFKIKFDDFQAIGKTLFDAIHQMEAEQDENAVKCKMALKSVMDKMTEALK